MWPFTSSSSQPPSSSSATDQTVSADKCPVDHDTRLAWLAANPGTSHPFAPVASSSSSSATEPTSASSPSSSPRSKDIPSTSGTAREHSDDLARLSSHRVVSSIPRHYASPSPTPSTTNPSPTSSPSLPETLNGGETPSDSIGTSEAEDPPGGNWVYPSPLQFYNAMKRKSQNPSARDMDVVVPIHNAVNEEAWRRIMVWENLRRPSASASSSASSASSASTVDHASQAAEPVKLLSFQGKPRELTWRAWLRTLVGYAAPFDRHDWTVTRDEAGHQRMRYIIDFYGGKVIPPSGSARSDAQGSPAGAALASVAGQGQGVAFFLDVRPAPDSVEAVLMRTRRTWRKWVLGVDDLGVGPQGRPTTLH